MFEQGRDYRFTTGFDREQATWVGEVVEVALPLIKVCQGYGEHEQVTILNVGAFDFTRAELQPYRSPEEKAAGRAKWEGLMGGLKPPAGS
ncbi:hypothetical protein [Methylobacterium sp. Leaf100]|uniref:hypothetical protein n=1 Tax=Methylobacterium sp. Leaf100 TaxID=1736252 RepID=UPI000A9BBEB2|nr:hypothetical protein [Methylobacterium sp. Leaf100]